MLVVFLGQDVFSPGEFLTKCFVSTDEIDLFAERSFRQLCSNLEVRFSGMCKAKRNVAIEWDQHINDYMYIRDVRNCEDGDVVECRYTCLRTNLSFRYLVY